MRLCVISDIHGNVEALRAALRKMRVMRYDRAAVVNDLETRQVPWRENVRRFIEVGRVS